MHDIIVLALQLLATFGGAALGAELGRQLASRRW